MDSVNLNHVDLSKIVPEDSNLYEVLRVIDSNIEIKKPASETVSIPSSDGNMIQQGLWKTLSGSSEILTVDGLHSYFAASALLVFHVRVVNSSDFRIAAFSLSVSVSDGLTSFSDSDSVIR